jgi:hypothetical protein
LLEPPPHRGSRLTGRSSEPWASPPIAQGVVHHSLKRWFTRTVHSSEARARSRREPIQPVRREMKRGPQTASLGA